MLADELLSYVFDGRMYPIASECAGWVDESRPFRAFVDRYRDKIRKKLRVCGDEEARRDLQVELATAFALLQEHRFSIEYELYASGKQRGPDLSVIFKDHIRFNVEVTRLRGGGAEPEGKPGGKQTNGAGKVTATICAKLGQMPPSVANILVLAADSAVYSPSDIDGVMKELKTQAERKDDAFFARRGLDESRDFFKYYPRLSGILTSSSEALGLGRFEGLWLNRETKHPLPPEIVMLLYRRSLRP